MVDTDDELWEHLRADADAAKEWEQLVAQASEIAQSAGPTPEAARIWRELARVLRERLDRPDDALAAYRAILAAHPNALPHPTLWESLCAFFGEAADYEGVVASYAARWG